MSPKHTEEEPEITAQPRHISDDLVGKPVGEEGLPGVIPEEMGSQFLTDATQQGNFESSRGGDTPEISITEGAPTDDALTGPTFDTDHTVWENTIDLSLQSGGLDEMQEEASPEGTDQNQGIVERRADEVNLTDDVIHEASLFDREGEELGEVETPEVKTDDHGRHRMRGRYPRTRTL